VLGNTSKLRDRQRNFQGDLGALRLKVSQSAVSASGSIQSEQELDLSIPDYCRTIHDFLKDFVENETLPDHAREDIRAIVIAGDVPPKVVGYLGNVVRRAVGGNIVKVLMNVDRPLLPIARGAAERA
jgi:hypothetical protein